MIRHSRNTRMNRHRNHRPSSRLLNSGHQPPIHQHRRRNPPRQLTQLRQRVPRLNHRLIQNLLRPDRITARLTPRPSQIHIQPHQPLLRPVMQIPLQPPQRRTLRPTPRLTRPRQPLNIRPIPSTPQQQHISKMKLNLSAGFDQIWSVQQQKQTEAKSQTRVDDGRVRNVRRSRDACIVDSRRFEEQQDDRLGKADGRCDNPDKRKDRIADGDGKRSEHPQHVKPRLRIAQRI